MAEARMRAGIEEEMAYEDAIARMHPIGRTATSTTAPIDESRYIQKMAGMNDIRRLLCKVLVKPSMGSRLCADTVGRLTGLHFCLIGPRGSGKHTATQSVCATCHIEMLTVIPYQYRKGDICYAIRYACAQKPCVIYFDRFEQLWFIKEFVDEFTFQILGQEALCETWEGVLWLAFAVESERILTDEQYPVRELCDRRCACVSPLTSEERASMLINNFMCIGGAAKIGDIDEIKEREWADLGIATENLSPGDLKKFAATAQFKAFSRLSMRTLSEDSGLKIWETSLAKKRQPPSAPPAKRRLDISWRLDCATSYEEDVEKRRKTGKQCFIVPKRASHW